MRFNGQNRFEMNIFIPFVLLSQLTVMTKSVTLSDDPFFQDTTLDVFGSLAGASIKAFLDYNYDKRSDMLIASADNRQPNVTKIQVLLGTEQDKERKSIDLLVWYKDSSHLRSVVPVDCDGDLLTDLVIIYQMGDCYSGKCQLGFQVCFSNGDSGAPFVLGECLDLPVIMKDEPLILDYNGDMLPDVLVEDTVGNYTVFLSAGSTRNYSRQVFQAGELSSLQLNHSSGFVDLNSDLAPDIALTLNSGILVKFSQTLANEIPNKLYPWPSDCQQRGMVTFLDIDADSTMDILLPCGEPNTSSSLLYLYNNMAWSVLPVKLNSPDGKQWNMAWSEPVWLRAGDVDNDGYPDLLVILENKLTQQTHPVIMLNVPCDSCAPFHRTYDIMWSWLQVEFDVTVALFADFNSDGHLDIVLEGHPQGTQTTQLYAFKSSVAVDSCFLYVQVASGLCPKENDCKQPYTNIVGATVRFSSIRHDGTVAQGLSTQLAQNTNGACQLMYSQFGLGKMPNFVDQLEVGVAKGSGSLHWSRAWTTIVPNSQLVVVPRPPADPDQWILHLYVTPSHLVLITGAVLLAVCGLVAILIGILHLKEKREDRRLKLQEAQRFHFNAM